MQTVIVATWLQTSSNTLLVEAEHKLSVRTCKRSGVGSGIGVSANFWPCRGGVCGFLSESLCVWNMQNVSLCSLRPTLWFSLPPHQSFSVLPPSLSLSFCSLTLPRSPPPSPPPPLSKLPYTPFSLSLSLSLSACQEEVNNMTFSRSDNILPREFPAAPAFLSHSHRFVFAPGASVFLRNDHLGTR